MDENVKQEKLGSNNKTQVLHLTSPIPKSVNHYKGIRVIYKNGRPMPVVFETKEAKEYKRHFIEYIKEQVAAQGWEKVHNKYEHVYMDGVFYFPKTNMDAANCDKILSDAITESGVVWDDDSGLLFRPQRIYYDKENPRIELMIYPVSYAGIFDCKEDLDDFEQRCKGCTRYARNCSILRKAKECRLQGEIKDCVCEKFKETKEAKDKASEASNKDKNLK